MPSTLEIPWARIRAEVQPGDRIVAIDGRDVDRQVHARPWDTDGAVRLVHPTDPDSEIVWNLYPNSHVMVGITVEREEPEPEPTAAEPTAAEPAPARPDLPFLDKRNMRDVRRSPAYIKCLVLLDPSGKATDLRTRLDNSPGYRQNRKYSAAGDAAHSCGVMAAHYGWTSKVKAYTYCLTPLGMAVLAYARKEGLA